MQDILNSISPGQWDYSNAAELLAVVIGAYLIIYEGKMNAGLTLVGLGVGMDNIGKLRKGNERDTNRKE